MALPVRARLLAFFVLWQTVIGVKVSIGDPEPERPAKGAAQANEVAVGDPQPEQPTEEATTGDPAPEQPPSEAAPPEEAERRLSQQEATRIRKDSEEASKARKEAAFRERREGEERQRERTARKVLETERDLEKRLVREARVKQEQEAAQQRLEERSLQRQREKAEIMERERLREEAFQLAKVQKRLVDKAVSQRKAAELVAFVAGRDVDPLGIMSRDPSATNTKNLANALIAATRDTDFVGRVGNASQELQVSIARAVKSIWEKITVFENASKEADAAHVAVLAAKFVADAIQLIKAQHQESANISKPVMVNVPPALKQQMYSVMPFFKPLGQEMAITATKLAWSSAPEACERVLELLEEVLPYLTNFTNVRSSLNATAASLPMLSTVTPDSKKEVIQLVQTFVNLGYMLIAGVEEVSKGIAQRVAPVIMHKLNCDSPVDSSVGSGGAIATPWMRPTLALAIAMTAWVVA